MPGPEGVEEPDEAAQQPQVPPVCLISLFLREVIAVFNCEPH